MIELSKIEISLAKAKQFEKKGITCLEELIRFLPRKYNDFSRLTGILPSNEDSCIVVRIDSARQHFGKTAVIIARGHETVTKAPVSIVWFQQNYLYNRIAATIGKDVYVVGKAIYDEEYHTYKIAVPSVYTPNIAAAQRIYPVYPKISGMSEEYLTGKISAALAREDVYTDPCPRPIVADNHQMPLKLALQELHNPSSMDALHRAQERILFDELLYFALRVEVNRRNTAVGSPFNLKTIKTMVKVINNLPFELTPDQKAGVRQMTDRMREGKRINALLQGDVGSGKTIVAFLMMIAMADSGYQAALMAPTQVLARQHYEDLKAIAEPYGLNVAFFSGDKIKKAEQKALQADLASGKIHLVVGTHALLSKNYTFKSLALTVTDEEHKFGVIQRDALIEKAALGVHSITMSATPIPRTLALAVYGNNIQMLTLKTPPLGRLPVKTAISSSFRGTFRFLCKELAAGHQAYIVCPMIDKSEDSEGILSVEETFAVFSEALKEQGYATAMLTGRNTSEETADIIESFRCNEHQVLVSTTVIEVGVNVPNATVIIICNAERFGLSGLHQLRGRVGRGNLQSYCVLFSTEKENERLRVLESTNDGFKIAEEDLRLRGAGDFIGTKQSGENKYISLMMAYPDKYEKAQKIASHLIDIGEEDAILASGWHGAE